MTRVSGPPTLGEAVNEALEVLARQLKSRDYRISREAAHIILSHSEKVASRLAEEAKP